MAAPKDEAEFLRGLRMQRDYLLEVNRSLESAVEAKPFAQRLYEETDWTIRALENWPADTAKPSPAEFGLTYIYDRLPGVLPVGPLYKQAVLQAFTASGTTGTYSVQERLLECDFSQTPAAQAFAKCYGSELSTIRQTYVLPEQVRAQLTDRLSDPELAQLFDTALRKYQEGRIGGRDRPGVAFAFRSLIEKVRGELWAKARKPHEQDARNPDGKSCPSA